MSRIRAGLSALTLASIAAPAGAEPPERIDILVDTTPEPDKADEALCKAEQEAAIITNEIVVCGQRDNSQHRLYSSDDSESRFAEETMNEGDIRTPDVAGEYIFTGPPTVSGLCGFLFNPCPAPPAILINFEELPATPIGSDADRVGRGLPPMGYETSPDDAGLAPAQ